MSDSGRAVELLMTRGSAKLSHVSASKITDLLHLDNLPEDAYKRVLSSPKEGKLRQKEITFRGLQTF